jgi:hypothetical protein
VETHHYLGSWPSVSHAYKLVDLDSPQPGGHLVGVLTLGVPTNDRVLTGPFPWLTANRQSLELNRFVLLDEVPANAESFCIAAALRQAADLHGVRAVIAHSDPMPRLRRTPEGEQQTLLAGHFGTIYRASNMAYLGRTARRRIWVLPDGRTLHGRTLAKIRKGERGAAAAEQFLVARGARPRLAGEPAPEWLVEAREAVGAVTIDHPGNYRYAGLIGPAREKRPLPVPIYPYPPYPDGLPL